VPDPASRPVTGSPWGALAPEGAHTAVGLAARTGAYCWAEQQVFALLGGWVQAIPEADVKLMVAEHAEHAAWRARRWHELLPTAPPGPDVLVVAPVGVPAVFAAAGVVAGGPDRTVEKLAVAHRVVLARLAAALRSHLDWSSEVTEAAVRRLLAISLDDVVADWTAGERLLQALTGESDALDRAHRAQATVEAPVAAAGGLLGPGSIGLRAAGGAP
jgi:hypothetical protein